MNRRFVGFALILFVASRIWVLLHAPYSNGKGYSDVKHDYERYANMWRYGLTPYYEHLYEYPPATIPLVYLPLEIDQQGIGYYYLNYRIQIFLIESFLFAILLYALNKQSGPNINKFIGIAFYIFSGLLAKDYWYEGLDLVFFGIITIALIWRWQLGHKLMWQRVTFWTLFWLSTSIKFLTAPLLIPFALPKIGEWKKELIAIFLGFMLVWGFPLVYFRSSLAVMFVVHIQRPLKYGSFGTFVVKAINDYTHSEIQSDLPPHFPIIGPVSSAVEKIVGLTYPIAILVFLIWSTWLLYSNRAKWKDHDWLFQSYLKICLVYMFTQFLSAKIFSSPFHIWYVPVMTALLYSNIQSQLTFYILALWMLGLDTTPYLKFPDNWIESFFKLERLRDASRFIPMFVILLHSLRSFSLTKNAKPNR